MSYSHIILGGSAIAIILFAFMRNNQANRNDKRRERLQKRQEELMEMLSQKNKDNKPGNSQ